MLFPHLTTRLQTPLESKRSFSLLKGCIWSSSNNGDLTITTTHYYFSCAYLGQPHSLFNTCQFASGFGDLFQPRPSCYFPELLATVLSNTNTETKSNLGWKQFILPYGAITKGIQGRISSKNLEVETETRDHGGVLLTSLLPGVYSARFLMPPRTTCSGWHHPQWNGPSTSSIKCSVDLPTGQSGGDRSSPE